MIDNTLDLKETKQSRVECVAEETVKLLSWCETGIKMICDKIKGLLERQVDVKKLLGGVRFQNLQMMLKRKS